MQHYTLRYIIITKRTVKEILNKLIQRHFHKMENSLRIINKATIRTLKKRLHFSREKLT